MSTIASLFTRAVVGVIFAGACIFIVAVAAAGIAWSTESAVYVPLVIDVHVEQENGMPAVLFEPQFAGMLVLLMAGVALAVATHFLHKRARTAPHV